MNALIEVLKLNVNDVITTSTDKDFSGEDEET